MNDLISRQAAIATAVRAAIDWYRLANPQYSIAYCIGEAMRALPPVQPKIKTGHWVYGEDKYGTDGYHCDKCGFFVPWDYTHKFINYIEDYKFCPHCGADMRGEQDGNV